LAWGLIYLFYGAVNDLILPHGGMHWPISTGGDFERNMILVCIG
jgi:hypothetical protein